VKYEGDDDHEQSEYGIRAPRESQSEEDTEYAVELIQGPKYGAAAIPRDRAGRNVQLALEKTVRKFSEDITNPKK